MFSEKQKKFASLPNELIVKVLQFCSGIDIINIGEAFNSDRFWDTISNEKLWERAVIGPPADYRKYSKYLGKHTRSLAILGTSSKKKHTKNSSLSILTESLVSSICLHCQELTDFTVDNCIMDSQVIKFSLFPKTLKFLKLSNISMTNLPQTRLAVRSSPFFCIKRSLPLLARLELCHAHYLHSSDSLAIISGCRDNPSLEIKEDNHYYTFQKVIFITRSFLFSISYSIINISHHYLFPSVCRS